MLRGEVGFGGGGQLGLEGWGCQTFTVNSVYV